MPLQRGKQTGEMLVGKLSTQNSLLSRIKFLLKRKKGISVSLCGRIDRIDQNTSGELAIFDYKTSDYDIDPHKTHGPKDDAWFDLQLPAYGLMLKRAMGLSPSHLGYINLSSYPGRNLEKLAQWDSEKLHTAEQLIEEIAGHIASERFWPPAEEFSGYDNFKLIFSQQNELLAAKQETAKNLTKHTCK